MRAVRQTLIACERGILLFALDSLQSMNRRAIEKCKKEIAAAKFSTEKKRNAIVEIVRRYHDLIFVLYAELSTKEAREALVYIDQRLLFQVDKESLGALYLLKAEYILFGKITDQYTEAINACAKAVQTDAIYLGEVSVLLQAILQEKSLQLLFSELNSAAINMLFKHVGKMKFSDGKKTEIKLNAAVRLLTRGSLPGSMKIMLRQCIPMMRKHEDDFLRYCIYCGNDRQQRIRSNLKALKHKRLVLSGIVGGTSEEWNQTNRYISALMEKLRATNKNICKRQREVKL